MLILEIVSNGLKCLNEKKNRLMHSISNPDPDKTKKKLFLLFPEKVIAAVRTLYYDYTNLNFMKNYFYKRKSIFEFLNLDKSIFKRSFN